ncbi:4-galactosyl-N-acetylglucosaminide 3-alpha-L-fucosyltransferase FUT6-like [Liolophura sinensis]|uniref:4-galactosyl-N-acetylglucosaminide 3-alpha-L-fucosyltransferase FUT6-like n=1 Tax=Liolophura sinensis TaxID=3198878 RepID=UPI0031582D6D
MRMKYKRFLVSGFCVIFLFILLGYLLSPRSPPYEPSKAMLKFRQLKSAYRSKLAKYKKIYYGPAKNYVTYGQPLGQLFAHRRDPSVKQVLLWTSFHGRWNYFPEKVVISDGRSCVRSTDRSNLNQSHAVVIHSLNLDPGVKDLPRFRLPFQRWVFFVMESPRSNSINMEAFQGVFNWTVTYRRDADFMANYFVVQKRKKPLTDDETAKLKAHILHGKQKLIAFLDSDCGERRAERRHYVFELQKYVRVDIYGGCAGGNCTHGSGECKKILSTYKFYLALENSHCRDFITEKVRQPLVDWEAVPVVLGADHPSTYEELLPPGSYIHADGFHSVLALAKYLVLLNRNQELYEMYHEWRRTYQVLRNLSWPRQLCDALHNQSLPIQTYSNFSGWYNEDVCKSGAP